MTEWWEEYDPDTNQPHGYPVDRQPVIERRAAERTAVLARHGIPLRSAGRPVKGLDHE